MTAYPQTPLRSTPCRDTKLGPDGKPYRPDLPKDILKIMDAIKERVVQLYADYDVPLPSRQYWMLNDPAYDCEQMVVSLMSLQEGLIGTDNAPQSPCDVFITATFKVTIVRCVPGLTDDGQPPSASEIEAASRALAMDAYLLMKSSCWFDVYGVDIEGAPLGGMGVDASVETQEVNGRMQAVVLNFTSVIG